MKPGEPRTSSSNAPMSIPSPQAVLKVVCSCTLMGFIAYLSILEGLTRPMGSVDVWLEIYEGPELG